MSKTKKTKRSKSSTMSEKAHLALGDSAESEQYRKYCRDNERKLRQLEREAKGYNMEAPDFASESEDY